MGIGDVKPEGKGSKEGEVKQGSRSTTQKEHSGNYGLAQVRISVDYYWHEGNGRHKEGWYTKDEYTNIVSDMVSWRVNSETERLEAMVAIDVSTVPDDVLTSALNQSQARQSTSEMIGTSNGGTVRNPLWNGVGASAQETFWFDLISLGGGKLIGRVAVKQGAKMFLTRSTTKLSATGAKWAQKTFGASFSSTGKFAGKTVDDIAAALRSGAMSPADVPLDAIVRNGETIILNTRSSAALIKANIPRSSWNLVNRTGDAAFEDRLTAQLVRNKLESVNGIHAIRQSGTTTLLTGN